MFHDPIAAATLLGPVIAAIIAWWAGRAAIKRDKQPERREREEVEEDSDPEKNALKTLLHGMSEYIDQLQKQIMLKDKLIEELHRRYQERRYTEGC